jgi:hypothetical protein
MAMQCEVLHYLYYHLLLCLEFHGNQDIWHNDYTWKQTRSEDIILVLKYERKKRQEIIHWWADNVNTDHNYEDVDQMHFAPDRVQIWVLVNVVMNSRFHKSRKFFNSSIVSMPTWTASWH